MLKGIHIMLLIGPAVPVPAPRVVMDALASAQVSTGKERAGFQLVFTLAKTSTLLTTMLPVGYFDPMVTRVILIVTVGGLPHVLMDGIVTRQEISSSNEPGKSTLTVTGEDLSVLMDVVELVKSYPAMPDIAQVAAALAPYAAFGVTPALVPPIIPTTTIPTRRHDTQVGTDLAYIKSLAQRCGYVFYVEPGPLPGQSLAYFGPDVRLPIPQHALSVNMDAHSNVESLGFSLDGMAKKARVYAIMDPFTGKIPITIPVPNANLFKPPMGARPTLPSRIEFACRGAQLAPDEAARDVLGFMMNAPQAVTGNGRLDVLRYGHVLRARAMVGVRGAGIAYDGMYYVDSVTHHLKRGEYKQDFTLSRDGMISNVPRVLP